jgi:hypothetical protein
MVGSFGTGEVDPLVDRDALLEAQVLDVRLDAARGVVGVLFELRVALHLSGSNTGVLVAGELEEFHWVAERRRTDVTAWNIVASSVDDETTGLRLSLACYPEAALYLRAGRLAYFNCQVSGIGEVPPDYGDSDDEVRRSVAGWQSEVEIVSAFSRVGRRPA